MKVMRSWKISYLVVDLTPILIWEIVVFESLQTIDANVEICGIEDCDTAHSVIWHDLGRRSRLTVSGGHVATTSIPEDTQEIFVVHEILRHQDRTTFFHCSCEFSKNASPCLTR
jgi:hypothetical protein